MVFSYFNKQFCDDDKIIHNSFYDVKKQCKLAKIKCESFNAFCTIFDIKFKLAMIQIKTFLGYHFVLILNEGTNYIIYDPAKSEPSLKYKKYLFRWTGKILIFEDTCDIMKV